MDNRVFLAACPDYQDHTVTKAVERVFGGFGGVSAFGVSGKTVVLKVNLLSQHKPEAAVTTHPSVVAALARLLIAEGARVVIADSPSGLFSEESLRAHYRISGMERVAEETGAALNYNTAHTVVEAPEGAEVGRFHVLNVVLEADLVFSVAKLKTHGFCYYTGAAKNIFGVVPGLDKAAMHSRFVRRDAFNRMLVDLCELIGPVFSIVDGVYGMEGAGPSGGTPKFAGVIGGAANPYALDLMMCRVATLPAPYVPLLQEARRRGLAPASHAELRSLGDPAERFETRFEPAVHGTKARSISGFLLRYLEPRRFRGAFTGRLAPWPVIRQSCIGCAKCAEICPRGVIALPSGRAKIDYEGCIRCYCCHEACPVKAIDLKKRRASRRADGGN